MSTQEGSGPVRLSAMELQFEVQMPGDLLLATCTGIATAGSFLELVLQVCNIAAERGVRKVLFNALAISGNASTFERYDMGAKVSDHLLRQKMDLRLAIVGVPPTVDGFGALVARNRGVIMEVFPTVEKALAWLGRMTPIAPGGQ